jgi:hypothetical protein
MQIYRRAVDARKRAIRGLWKDEMAASGPDPLGRLTANTKGTGIIGVLVRVGIPVAKCLDLGAGFLHFWRKKYRDESWA